VNCDPEQISCAIRELTNAVQHSRSFWGAALPPLTATLVGAGISAGVTLGLFRRQRSHTQTERAAAEDSRYIERVTAGSARVIDELGIVVEAMQTSLTHDEPGSGRLWSAAQQLKMLVHAEDAPVANEIERICARAPLHAWDSRLFTYIHLMNEIQRWRTEGDDDRLQKELRSLPYPPLDPKYV
jgi:hypothetical protein